MVTRQPRHCRLLNYIFCPIHSGQVSTKLASDVADCYIDSGMFPTGASLCSTLSRKQVLGEGLPTTLFLERNTHAPYLVMIIKPLKSTSFY